VTDTHDLVAVIGVLADALIVPVTERSLRLAELVPTIDIDAARDLED
jgi:hypothetical protein